MVLVISQFVTITTYVLSQHPNYWHIDRFADDSSEPLADTQTEEAAMEMILEQAQEKKPSRVLRIGLMGDSRVVAKFDA